MKHINKPYITVEVEDGNIEKSIRKLKKSCTYHGVFTSIKRKRHHWKPSEIKNEKIRNFKRKIKKLQKEKMDLEDHLNKKNNGSR